MRLISFAKTLKQFEDGSKDVTRRDGWLHARRGDLLMPVEWSPRVGPRWFCEFCMEPGPTDGPSPYRTAGRLIVPSLDARRRAAERIKKWFSGHRHGQPLAADHCNLRTPRKLSAIRVLSVRRERLGDIDVADVCREGFPGMSTESFVQFFCSPKKPDPRRIVSRIEFEKVSP